MIGMGTAPLHKSAGFSLLELMIVLVLMGILVSIGYPSYIGYVEAARRTDGIGGLLTLAAKQEKYYMNAGSYADDMTLLGLDADPGLSDEGFYRLDATLTAGGQGYTLTATRTGIHTSDTFCGDLVLTSTGIKTAVNNTSTNPVKDCWE